MGYFPITGIFLYLMVFAVMTWLTSWLYNCNDLLEAWIGIKLCISLSQNAPIFGHTIPVAFLKSDSQWTLLVWILLLKSALTTRADKDVSSPSSDKISHLPQGRQRGRRTRPAVPHDTCPCSPGSVACCSRPVMHSPLPAAPPALASPRLLPASGSRWGYYHWSMSEGMKVERGKKP